MAGISLPLRSLLGSRSFVAQAAGYAYAGLAMAGPWLLTSLHMQILGRLDLPGVAAADLQSFQAVVLYAYCASMLLTGVLQLAVARHLSDRLFIRDTSAVVPAYAAAAILSLMLHAAVGLFALAWLRPPLPVAVAELGLFVLVGLVSTGMIFLGVLRNFTVILAAFLAGTASALALSQVLGPRFGLAGLIGGFAAGHALIAVVFGARLRAEFPARQPWTFGLLATAARHPALPVIGLATAASIWIDKILFWVGPWGLRTESGLRICPVYDNGFFFASFTILPALVILFIRLEGSFHDRYKQFYDALRQGADLEAIRRARAGIVESFGTTLLRVAVIQGLVTLAAILAAPALIEQFRLDWLSFYVFRASCLGAYVQMLALAVLLSAIHLALYRVAVVVSLASLLAGTAGAAATILIGPEWLGFGTVASGAIGLVVGYPWVRSVLAGLERHTFMGQVGS